MARIFHTPRRRRVSVPVPLRRARPPGGAPDFFLAFVNKAYMLFSPSKWSTADRQKSAPYVFVPARPAFSFKG